MSKLERTLGLPAVVAISISAMLGSGIFVLPGLAYAKAGPSVWLAYVVAGICVLPAALSKAELATAMPTSGGTYVYIDRAFGPLAGTAAGLGLWLSLLLKSSFALVGFGAYLHVLADVPIKPTALAMLALIVALNVRGIRGVSQVQIIIMALSVAALAILGVLGVLSFESANLEPAFPHGTGGFIAAIGFVFVSYAGVTKVAAIAEEVRNPARNLPAGILISLVIATVLYGLVTLVLVGNIPGEIFASDVRPVHSLATAVSSWPVVAIAAAVLGVVTMTSMANAGLLAASRFPFAMARDDLLPALLRRLHRTYLTPIACILISAAIMAGAILVLDIERIAKLASAFMILLFMGVNVAVMVLRETRVQWYRPRFRAPFYPWIQVFGVVSGGVLMVVLGPAAMAATVVALIAGASLFLFYGRKRTERMGVLGQRGPRRDLLSGGMPVAASPEDELPDEAAVLVSLFGGERSPEMLVELAKALAEAGDLEVLHVKEVPQQLSIDALSAEDDLRLISVKRRLEAMAADQDIALRFDSVHSRDVIQTVYDATESLACRWLVIEWSGRTRSAFTVGNPLGWWSEHVGCNLATFYDAGVRYVRKILVHVAPGPHDALVLGTADHLAEVYGAELTFVRTVPKDADAAATQAAADYLNQVNELCQARSQTQILRGHREEESLAKASHSYDLLITGAAPTGTMWRQIRGTGLDRLTERAACSVLRLQAPRSRTHEAFERYHPKAPDERRFMDFLEPDCVLAGVAVGKKEALFERVGQAFAEVLPETTPAKITEGLWERERTQNTGLGGGIALPHATIEAAARTRLGIITCASSVSYGSPDGLAVDVCFVTLGTAGDRQEHLVVLSAIAKLCSMTPLLDELRGAQSTEEMLEAVRRRCEELEL